MRSSGPWERFVNDPLGAAEAEHVAAGLRRYARDRLPDAMVPAEFVELDSLPRTPNGKLDRRRLPALESAARGVESEFVAPRTEVERRVCAVWAEILRTDRVGVHDSFFALGGDSLTAVQMVSRLRREFTGAVSVRLLFEQPTPEQLARMLEGAGAPASPGGAPSLSIGPEELEREATLPDDIQPAGLRRAPPRSPGQLLLTGATGFLGAFLLRELLVSGSEEAYCLVRARDPEVGGARLRENLARYELWDDAFASRIRAVPGDLGRPYLGLDRGLYERLARDVDAIYHNGAWSSFVLPYSRLKPINVLGTQEILRLACRERLKPVHFISSLAVFPGHRDIKRFAETDLQSADGVVGGYPQTKWVADRLLSIARSRGIPASSYRPGQVTGDSRTGACDTELFVCGMMKSCIQLGLGPDPDMMVEMVPVDFVARAVAKLSRSPEALGRVFHLPSENAAHWVELIDMINDCGYPLRRVPYGEWFQALNEAVKQSEENALIPFLPLFGEDGPAEDLAYQNGNPVFECERMKAALAGSGIECPPVSMELLRTYLAYFQRIGFIHPPGAS